MSEEQLAQQFTGRLHDLLGKENLDAEGSVRFYEEEAEKYDKVLEEVYASKGPPTAAARLAELVPEAERAGLKVLDVAAGTGRVGKHLADEHGFRNVDALEPSRKMLDVLEGKKVYNRTFCQYFGGGNKFDVADGHYDAVIISGAFVKGHLPVDALREVARVLTPGGHFVTSITHEKFSEDYDKAVEDELAKMEEEKVWRLLEKKYYSNREDVKGICYAFQKI